jgi:hypothetical protein
MKAMLTTALAALLLAFLATACSHSAPRMAELKKFATCDGRGRTSISRINKASFGPVAAKSCLQSLDPFDLSAWVEAPMVSYRERGLQTMVLGCANLVPDAAGCDYSGLPGHAATMDAKFNFSTYPATARVQKAVLAIYAENNAEFLKDNAQVRARLTQGDYYQSLGWNRTAPAYRKEPHQGWIIIDITDFAARAINEQRDDITFEISLPCGRSEDELTTVRVLKSPPVVVVEYK